MARVPEFLSTVHSSIAKHPQRSAMVRALRSSLDIDISAGGVPKPPSPKSISQEFGLSLELLLNVGVVLTREQAYIFAAEVVGLNLTLANFRRRYGGRKYKEIFGREVSRLGPRRIVWTYAEVLHLIGHLNFRVKVTEELIELRD